jgi:hypothetical protein
MFITGLRPSAIDISTRGNFITWIGNRPWSMMVMTEVRMRMERGEGGWRGRREEGGWRREERGWRREEGGGRREEGGGRREEGGGRREEGGERREEGGGRREEGGGRNDISGRQPSEISAI